MGATFLQKSKWFWHWQYGRKEIQEGESAEIFSDSESKVQ